MIFQDTDFAPGPAGALLLLRLGSAFHRALGVPGSEIAPCPWPVTVPGAAPWLRGLVLHKGEALPLVDLAVALDEAAPPVDRDQARMLVTFSGGARVAFLVDDVDVDDGRDDAIALDLDAVSRDLLTRATAVVAP